MFDISVLRFVFITAAMLFASSANATLAYAPGKTPQGGSYLIVSGSFESTDNLAQFVSVVQANDVKAVFFNSPGGNVAKAMELGRLIRALRLATMQIRSVECASACAFAFMGGAPRYADPGSIGVHKSSFSDTSDMNIETAVSAVQQLTAETIAYMSEMGVDPALLQLSLQYSSADIRYLSGSEMEHYRLALPFPNDPNDSTTPSTNQQQSPAVASLPPSLKPISTDMSIPSPRTGRVQNVKGKAPLKADISVSAKTLLNIPNGTPVQIVGDTDKWYRVKVGGRLGYLHHAWVWIDQFNGVRFGKRFVQVKSFDNIAETEAFIRSNRVPLVAFLATNGWFALTVDREFSSDADAIEAKEKLIAANAIPDDSIVTYGNAFVRKICCQSAQ